MKNNITVLSAWEINLELNSFLCQDVNIFFVESVLKALLFKRLIQGKLAHLFVVRNHVANH